MKWATGNTHLRNWMVIVIIIIRVPIAIIIIIIRINKYGALAALDL